MKRLAIATIATAACAHGAASAQQYAPYALELHELRAPIDDARTQADAWKRWADDFSREMRASMSSLYANRVVSHRLVKGAPYSARVVTELNQPLADGNVISHKHEGAVYRDGEGRTRQETVVESGKRSSVVIDDPVGRKHYVLMPDFKRAVETTSRVKEAKVRYKHVMKVDGKEVRVDEDGKVFLDGRAVTEDIDIQSKNGKRVVVGVKDGRILIDGKEVDTVAGDGRVRVHVMKLPEGTREEVRVQVVRPGEGFELPPGAATPPLPPTPPVSPPGVAPLPPVPPVPPIPGVQTMRFESMGKLGKGKTTDLGTKDIEGVKAQGKQTTWTIAAGEIGNRNPIEVTSESWFSPDLQVTVYSRYNDPRTGESIYRLAGIKRGEPAADLFKVPADYDVRSRGR